MVKVYLNDPIADSALERLRAHVELVDNFDHPEELDAIIVRRTLSAGRCAAASYSSTGSVLTG